MSAKQLAIVIASPSSAIWGAERSMLTLAEFIRRDLPMSGIDLSLVTTSKDLDSLWKNRVGFSSVYCGGKIPTARTRIGRSILITLRLLSKRDSRIVLFHADLLPFVALVSPFLHFRGNRIVLDLHYYYPSSRGRKKVGFFSRAIDGVIGVSDFVLDQIPAHKNAECVVRPISEPIRGRLVGPEGPARFLIAGRTSPDKAVDLIIDLLANTEDYIFVVRGGPMSVADSEYFTEVLSAAKRFGDRFVYEGFVDRSQLFDRVDALLLLNDREASGRVVGEAQMVGCLPIVPSRGGSSQHIVDGVTGFVYSSEGSVIDNIVAVLDRFSVLSDRGELEEYSKVYASERYSAEARSREYLQALSKL